MERIVYRKTLDVHKNGIQFTLQGFETADNMSRRIEISLMASGDTIDMPLEQITAMMFVKRPNETKPSINACTIKDNKIIYDVLPIGVEGITEMQLKLIETRFDGAEGVLASPKFAVEVSESNTDESGVPKTTFTALENAIARAYSLQEKNITGVELDDDFVFKVNYVDGTSYESDILKELKQSGEVLLSQSYARGGTGVRTGEDTDNSMYYSNVSKSASAEASKSTEESADILNEVRKHGVYTSFSVDFEKGELRYMSPTYDFNVNQENGNLEAEGGEYNPDEVIQEYMRNYRNETDKELSTAKSDITGLKGDVADLQDDVTELKGDVDNIYPVGSVYATSTNTNPSNKLGGTWVLIDKEFRNAAEEFEDVFAPQFALDGWSDSQYKLSGVLATINDDEDYSNGLYKTNITVIRANHTVRLRIKMYPQTGDGSEAEVSFSDIGTSDVLKINFSKLGFKGFPTGFLDVLATSDTIGQAIMFSLNYTSYSNGKEVGATLYQSDVIGNSKSVVITEGMSVEPITLDITSPVLYESMLDGYCDKFYWKRTA